jgi:hypothetical protein
MMRMEGVYGTWYVTDTELNHDREDAEGPAVIRNLLRRETYENALQVERLVTIGASQPIS